jgi:hypothetical protein
MALPKNGTERHEKTSKEPDVERKGIDDVKAVDDAIKVPKVRGPAWLAFTGKSNGKTDAKPVKPVTVDPKPVAVDAKPVSGEANGSNNPPADSKPVSNGSKPAVADSKPVLKDLKPVLVETKTEGTPKPEPAPLASEEITTRDLVTVL